MKPYLIGIAGGTGSGKSTFANKLFSNFPEQITMIAYDNYYKSQSHLSADERKKVNYDCPEVLDTELLIEHLKELKMGREINIPVYDFKTHTRLKEAKAVCPKNVIIVDGILTFHNIELRNMFDLKIYVDGKADERVLRRMKRDIEERGRTIDSVITQYLDTVQPMHDLYVEPTKKYADIIINGGMNTAAYELVKDRIEKLI